MCRVLVNCTCTKFSLKIILLSNTIQSHSSSYLSHSHWNHLAPLSMDHVAPADWADLKFLMHSKQARPVWSGSVLILLMTLSSITKAYLSIIKISLSCLNNTNIPTFKSIIFLDGLAVIM